MPNIPNFAGLVTSGEDALVSFGGATLIRAVFGDRWSIVNEYGVPILLSDSFIAFDYTNTQDLCTDPIENGKVRAYNKVNNPRQCNVTLAKSSDGALGRGAWLGQIETYANSTLKFHIITPEFVYTNMMITQYGTSRTSSNGYELIKVNIQFTECKLGNVKYEKEQVKNVDDTRMVDNGKVQAEQDDSILNKIGNLTVDLSSKLFGN